MSEIEHTNGRDASEKIGSDDHIGHQLSCFKNLGFVLKTMESHSRGFRRDGIPVRLVFWKNHVCPYGDAEAINGDLWIYFSGNSYESILIHF